ncbi:MAG: NAD(P)-binding protein, partial [Nannocystis sp.]
MPRRKTDLPPGTCANTHAPKASSKTDDLPHKTCAHEHAPSAGSNAPGPPAASRDAACPEGQVPIVALSRRTLLAAATAAATAAACGPSTPPPPITAFVGPDPAQAHRLRDGGWPEGPIVKPDIHTQVAIVGGGVAGLAAAWRLRRAGLDNFNLFELEPELGGTARGGQLPRSPHPLGAHYLPSPHPECRALELLLTELGIIVGRDAGGRAEYLPSAIVAAPTERH